MSREETERIRAELRARPHLAGECVDARVDLMQEVERLTAERDAARAAAEHLWFHGEEHGVSHEEARRWYPWLYELHEQKQAERSRQATEEREQPKCRICGRLLHKDPRHGWVDERNRTNCPDDPAWRRHTPATAEDQP